MSLFDQTLDLAQKPSRTLQVIRFCENGSEADEVERDGRLPAELRAPAKRFFEHNPSLSVAGLTEDSEREIGESVGSPSLVLVCSEVGERRLELPSRSIKVA